MPLFTLLCLCY